MADSPTVMEQRGGDNAPVGGAEAAREAAEMHDFM